MTTQSDQPQKSPDSTPLSKANIAKANSNPKLQLS